MNILKRTFAIFNKLYEHYKRILWSPEKYARKIGVKIGEGCFISTRYFSSEPYLIEIGNHVRVASNVRFFTHGGVWSQRKKHPKLDYFGKIKIGNYSYVGEGAFIMPGVTIGNDVIIGAGSVVTKSVPDGCIVAGNPGRIVGTTDDFIKKVQKISVDSYGMTDHEKEIFLLSLDDDKFIKK